MMLFILIKSLVFATCGRRLIPACRRSQCPYFGLLLVTCRLALIIIAMQHSFFQCFTFDVFIHVFSTTLMRIYLLYILSLLTTNDLARYQMNIDQWIEDVIEDHATTTSSNDWV